MGTRGAHRYWGPEALKPSMQPQMCSNPMSVKDKAVSATQHSSGEPGLLESGWIMRILPGSLLSWERTDLSPLIPGRKEPNADRLNSNKQKQVPEKQTFVKLKAWSFPGWPHSPGRLCFMSGNPEHKAFKSLALGDIPRMNRHCFFCSGVWISSQRRHWHCDLNV